MNELAIRVLQDKVIELYRDVTMDNLLEYQSNMQQIESAIQQLQNPEEFDEFDMVESAKWADSGKFMTYGDWLSEYRKQKEGKQ